MNFLNRFLLSLVLGIGAPQFCQGQEKSAISVSQTSGEDESGQNPVVKNKKSAMGSWSIQEEQDPMNDSKAVMATLLAKSVHPWGKLATLVLVCQNKTMKAYIDWNGVAGVGQVNVTTRFDEGDIQTKVWNTSADFQATFYPGNPQAFISALVKSKKFRAQIMPYGQDPITNEFETIGLQEAIKPLQAACK